MRNLPCVRERIGFHRDLIIVANTRRVYMTQKIPTKRKTRIFHFHASRNLSAKLKRPLQIYRLLSFFETTYAVQRN